jgi:biopolymer transport protein ExbD
MKFRKRESNVSAEPDMTPMIDMTFQLIIFFMVALNFGEGEQDLSIKLPSSELAKPPEAATELLLVLQLNDENMVLFAGDQLPISAMTRPLTLERRALEEKGKSAADATVFIRADGDAQTGVVQELIQKCQENGFEKFSLRAKFEQKS